MAVASSSGLVTVPSSVAFPGNATYVSFVAHTHAVTANTTVNVQSIYNGGTPFYASVTLTP